MDPISINFCNYEVEKQMDQAVMHACLKLGLSAQQRNRKIIHSTSFERIIVPIPALYEMVIGHPFHGSRVGALVHRGRMQDHRLVISDIAPATTFAGEELRVEAPGGDGVDYGVV